MLRSRSDRSYRRIGGWWVGGWEEAETIFVSDASVFGVFFVVLVVGGVLDG